MLVKYKVRLDTSFNFNEATCFEIEEEINKLNPKKASTRNSIPTKILKQNSEVCKQHLTNIIILAIRDGNFPKELNLADVTPIFKKDNPNDPKNYRPVSVLRNISKIFERILQKQISLHINNFLSQFLRGFKGFNTQQALLRLIEK